jgi:dipeptidase E
MHAERRSDAVPQIVALGGGGFSMERGNRLLDDYIVGLSRTKRARVCFLPTASGDADHYIVRFYRAFPAERFETSHISLFRRDEGAADIHRHLLESDVVYVGGGNVVSMLGAWRAHGLDATLRQAWERGVILAGVSAGSLCWFDSAVTAFHGNVEQVKGIGLLPWSNCVHLDAEPVRNDGYRRLLLDGMCPGFAAEDCTALHFAGDQLLRVVASKPGARAFAMAISSDGLDVERRALDVFYLGDAAAAAAPPRIATAA